VFSKDLKIGVRGIKKKIKKIKKKKKLSWEV
jgi:hypothetical protein